MKVKTNVRAGSGGASGGGHNGGGDSGGHGAGEVEVQQPQPVYVPPVSRCVGI